jgi:hypothetical protein
MHSPLKTRNIIQRSCDDACQKAKQVLIVPKQSELACLLFGNISSNIAIIMQSRFFPPAMSVFGLKIPFSFHLLTHSAFLLSCCDRHSAPLSFLFCVRADTFKLELLVREIGTSGLVLLLLNLDLCEGSVGRFTTFCGLTI